MSAHEATRPSGTSPALGHAGMPVTTVVVIAAVLRASWGLLERGLAWTERHRQRRALLALDDHLLKDIGITRLDADREGGKPFWRE